MKKIKNSKIYNKLFNIKILIRNIKARNIIKEQAKSSVEKLEKIDVNEKNIFYCGIPMHKNLGDQAQRFCIDKWCKENYNEYKITHIPTWAFYSKFFCNKLNKVVKNEDIFIIQSGYCTTNRHFDHKMHRYIAKKYTNNKILIMPQTVNFVQDSEAKKTGNIYNKNKKLLFLARDRISYESAKKYFGNTKILLYPDIVTSLIGSRRRQEGRDGILLCIRNDGEKKYTNNEINILKEKFINDGIKCDIKDTNSSLEGQELIEKFSFEFDNVLNNFASYNVVITDRYHGTIFSMISNTPVIILETVDHKVKTGTEWFKGIYEGAYYNASSLEEAYNIAKKIMNEKVEIQNTAYFKKEYFDKLKEEFERMG